MAAQALVAADRSVDDAFVMHSLHSYFLRPGDTAVPIVYDVERIRDGRSFATRRVVARQHGRPIYYLTASFQKPEDGFEHQDLMPDVVGARPGGPDGRPGAPAGTRSRRRSGSASGRRSTCATSAPRAMGLAEDPEHPARARLWIRIAGDLADDPLTHRAAFTYASDLTLLGAALVPHGVHFGTPGMQMASLDHTMWFHRPFRADEWWLYDQVLAHRVGRPRAGHRRGSSPRTARWSRPSPRRA